LLEQQVSQDRFFGGRDAAFINYITVDKKTPEFFPALILTVRCHTFSRRRRLSQAIALTQQC